MLMWRQWGNYKRSLYNAPTEFGKFETAGEFGSWFFNMAGSQIPQYAVFALSGGSAYIPLAIMGISATGSSDLDFREQVIRGERDYGEASVLWRSILSRTSETVFAKCSNAFDGIQPFNRQTPPKRVSLSTIVTSIPRSAAKKAAA